MLLRKFSRGLVGCVALAASGSVFALGSGGKINRCEAVFGTGLQAHTNGIVSVSGTIPATAAIKFNSDSAVLRAISAPSNNRCNVTGVGLTRCLPTGHPSSELSAGSFQGTSSTSTLSVSSTATVPQSEYSSISVGLGATVNFPAGTYKINTLTTTTSGIINLGAGDYWIRNLSLGVSASINVVGTGTARIFVENFSGDTSSQLNWGSSPAKLVVYSYGDLPPIGGGRLSGFFYATGTAHSTTDMIIEGSISGNVVEMGLNAQITDKSQFINDADFGHLCDQQVVDVDDPKRVVNQRSLLVNEIAVLNYNQNGHNFSLTSTLNALGATMSPTIGGSNLARRLWELELDEAQDGALDNNGEPKCSSQIGVPGATWPHLCDRSLQEGRQAFDPAARAALYKPVALVNRTDLVDSRLSPEDCGEFRIVYAHDDPDTGVNNDNEPGNNEGREVVLSAVRSFIIFEARMPNPNPALGGAGCTAVHEYWASLTDVEDPNVRAEKLWNFFFDGMPLAGGGKLEPLLKWSNFSGDDNGSGQVRTNQFLHAAGTVIPSKPWVLKEYHLAQNAPYVSQSTVNSTPHSSLFDLSDTSVALGAYYRSEFLAGLVSSGHRPGVGATHLENLLKPNLAASALTVSHPSLSDDIVEAAKLDYSESFASANRSTISHSNLLAAASKQVTTANGQESFLTQIAAKLHQLGILSTDGLVCEDEEQAPPCFSPQQVVQRAQAQTCAGCHQPAAFGLNQPNALGAGQSQPAPHGFSAALPTATGFVHTSGVDNGDGTYQLSPALTNAFLPFRNGILECFVNASLDLPECEDVESQMGAGRTM